MRYAIRLGTLAMGLAGCGTLEPGADDTETAPLTTTVTAGPSITLGNPDTSTVTFFSEAGLDGDSLTRDLTPTSLSEAVRPITFSEITYANLARRISSVRLTCGSRPSTVTVLSAANSSTDTSTWSSGGPGFMLACNPGQTVTVNLHATVPNLADAVGSAYFLVHATHKTELLLFSTLVASDLKSVSSFGGGVTASTAGALQMLNSTEILLHRDFQLDTALCQARSGYMDLLAVIDIQRQLFTAFVIDTFVADGLGDVLGCHDQMLKTLTSDANGAATQLTFALTDRLRTLGSHARYYLVPAFGLDDFDLAAGGDPFVQTGGSL
jgi:hypothetical protein